MKKIVPSRPASQSEAPPRSKYPELDEIAMKVADAACAEINLRVAHVQSAMPYKAQYALEKVIRILQGRV